MSQTPIEDKTAPQPQIRLALGVALALVLSGVAIFLLGERLAYPLAWQTLLSVVIALLGVLLAGRNRAAPERTPREPKLDFHFLFNCLTTIRFVVSEDTEKARSLILALSEFLKAKLSVASDHPFHLECALARAYLELEGARLEERLRVHWDVCEQTRAVMVPISLFQNYLAQCVGEQIRPHLDGGSLDFQAVMVGESLVVTIQSDRELPRPSEAFGRWLMESGTEAESSPRRLRVKLAP